MAHPSHAKIQPEVASQRSGRPKRRKGKHGGKRKGAGRPRVHRLRYVTQLSLHVQGLIQAGAGKNNVSRGEWLDQFIRFYEQEAETFTKKTEGNLD
jgi:hypothetical protein